MSKKNDIFDMIFKNALAYMSTALINKSTKMTAMGSGEKL
jgi:hypothetical protein